MDFVGVESLAGPQRRAARSLGRRDEDFATLGGIGCRADGLDHECMGRRSAALRKRRGASLQGFRQLE
ncbi:MAG: hypothetical protein KA911_09695 [Xanthomonadales bacterium]|nr:hypothetical protein [Xanthomonadales bacterium]